MSALESKREHLRWGGQGTLHFYTDDYRFTTLYEHPEKILQHYPRNIVEPNFSLFNEMPIAFGLQAVYKKRFIARAMQERNIRVFVDLNVANKFYKLNMLGVPMGWSAFATRGYSDRLHYLEFEYQLAKEYAQGNNLLFVIYGGGDKCKQFAKEHGCIYVTPTVVTRNKIHALKKIETSIAFFNEEFSTKKFIEEKKEKIKSLRVEDFSKKENYG